MKNGIDDTLHAKNAVIQRQQGLMTIPAVEQPPVQGELSVMYAAANMAFLATTGTQTGLRMKTIIGISAMSATKKKMFPCTLGIAVRSSFLQPVQHQGKKYTPVLYAATE